MSGGPGTTPLRTDELKHFATLDRWDEQSEEPDSAAVFAQPNDGVGDVALPSPTSGTAVKNERSESPPIAERPKGRQAGKEAMERKGGTLAQASEEKPNLARGEWLHRVPIGYKRIRRNGLRTLAIDPKVYPLLVEAKRLREAGFSFARISRLMERKGLRSKQGNVIGPGEICRILKREERRS